MYPGFIAEFNDQSDINRLPVTEVRNRALFGSVFTSDKGPEGWTRVVGKEFFNLYGKTISFARHGQPLLQSAMAINAGAEMLCKRLVADDAALANISLVATLSDTEVQATDADGNPLYLDNEGNQTVEVTENPVMTTEKTVKYSIKSVEGVKTLNEAFSTALKDCGEGEYLLYTIADNGRGTSKKRIKIVPNYRLSKGQVYTLYNLSVLENSVEDESMTFTTNPAIIVNKDRKSVV